jgi:hypothetical protein
MNFRGAWVSGTEYAVNDAVTFGTPTSTYLAAIAALSSSSNQPNSPSGAWTMLASAGGAGPTGAQGAAGAIGATGPQGPQGLAGQNGTGGSGSTSGISGAAVDHLVTNTLNYPYFSVSNTNGSTGESTSPTITYPPYTSLNQPYAVLTWVPAGCTATALNVYSQQGQTITVSLRVGTPGSMTTTALTCTAMPNGSGGTCPVTGSVSVPVGDFVDLEISNANSTPAGVWTALTCN